MKTSTVYTLHGNARPPLAVVDQLIEESGVYDMIDRPDAYEYVSGSKLITMADMCIDAAVASRDPGLYLPHARYVLEKAAGTSTDNEKRDVDSRSLSLFKLTEIDQWERASLGKSIEPRYLALLTAFEQILRHHTIPTLEEAGHTGTLIEASTILLGERLQARYGETGWSGRTALLREESKGRKRHRPNVDPEERANWDVGMVFDPTKTVDDIDLRVQVKRSTAKIHGKARHHKARVAIVAADQIGLENPVHVLLQCLAEEDGVTKSVVSSDQVDAITEDLFEKLMQEKQEIEQAVQKESV